MGVYLTGVHLKGVYLINVHLMGVYLINVHLTGVHLMGVYLIGVHFQTCQTYKGFRENLQIPYLTVIERDGLSAGDSIRVRRA